MRIGEKRLDAASGSATHCFWSGDRHTIPSHTRHHHHSSLHTGCRRRFGDLNYRINVSRDTRDDLNPLRVASAVARLT